SFQISSDVPNFIYRLVHGSVRPDFRQPEYIDPQVFIADVDTTTPIDQNVFRLRNQPAGLEADSYLGVRWHEIADLLRRAHIADIVDPQAGVKVSQIGDVVAILQASLVV